MSRLLHEKSIFVWHERPFFMKPHDLYFAFFVENNFHLFDDVIVYPVMVEYKLRLLQNGSSTRPLPYYDGKEFIFLSRVV